MLALVHTVSQWLSQVGYLAIFLVLFVESFGVPSPDEIILVFSGYLVWQGHFSYVLAVIAAVSGSTLGGIGAYYLARLGGRPLMLRYLGFIFRNPERIEYWERYFRTKGDKVVLIGRIISGVRAVISYPAGLFEMPIARFIGYTVAGSLIWSLLALTAGYLLGPHIIQALEASKRYEGYIGAGIVLLGIAWFLWERRRRQRAMAQKPPDPTDNSSRGSMPKS
ncbi:MAG: DedA family protein [Thermaerobacter sp.]|nr:DedA family protein [Thermaerobacter sp.]